MAQKANAKGAAGTGSSQPLARMVPAQKRSRERFELILQCAAELMIEKGSEALRMSDIVERTGIAFGSLYQYFPDKTAVIGTLAERYNVIGRQCVARAFAEIRDVGDLYPALCRITDEYYQMFTDNPVMKDIWTATQADRELQRLDEEDGRILSALLTDALRTLAPHASRPSLASFSQLTITLIGAAVREAIRLETRDARRMLALFKRLLPRDLSALE